MYLRVALFLPITEMAVIILAGGKALLKSGVPQKARDTLQKIRRAEGRAPSGYKGGRTFKNREGNLPGIRAEIQSPIKNLMLIPILRELIAEGSASCGAVMEVPTIRTIITKLSRRLNETNEG